STKDRIYRYRCRMFPCAIHTTTNSHSQSTAYWPSILPSRPVPVVVVGRLTFTSAGTVFGSQTRSVGGSTAVERITGTFSTNPNCTGTIIAQVFVSGALVRTSTIATIWVDNGRKARAVFKKTVLPDSTILPTVLTTEADRLF